MAKLVVNTRELKNEDTFKELKKEVIEILKKQDEREVKKAIEFFSAQESRYTHLEKSITGKWIEKAGYGIGTVRIWKGKKYKKIAPGKWARVFEKEGRGTNIAIGKLIAKVQKIDNVEDLMAFVMANKQRFVDDNGIDLPVLDKLRAAVDKKNNGGIGSKGTSKLAEKYDAKAYEEEKDNVLRHTNKDFDSVDAAIFDLNRHKNWIDRKSSDETEHEKNVREARLKAVDDIIEGLKRGDNKLLDKFVKNKPAEDLDNGVYKTKEELEKMSIDELDKYKDAVYNKYKKIDLSSKKIIPARVAYKEAYDTWREKVRASKDMMYTFETKLMNRLQDGIESQKKACEEWDIKEWSDNKLETYIEEAEKWKDKGLVHLADPIIKKFKESGKDMFDNNDFVGPSMNYQGFAVAHSKAYDNMKKELEARKKAKEEEIKPEKPVEEKKETPKEEKTEKIYSVDNSGEVVSFDELQPIASNKSVGENEVQLPYSKDLANEIESLKDCVVPKWDNREFMKHVYYEDGKLITTDARRMKFIEIGELEGIPDGSYVDITTDKSGINIKKIDLDARFPNYKKVIPDNLNQSATLDTKLVKDKIKEMQKDGAISRKGSNIVQLEFRDGKVFIDDTAVGEAKDIKMKYGEGWGPARNDTNYMAINADYLVNALSGKKSVLQIGERADKAVVINTGSSSNILMPMSGSDKKMDYGKGRKEKQEANDKKSALKAAYKKANEDYIASIKENYGERFKRLAQSAADNLTERMSDMSDETLKLNYDRLKFNLDKVMDKKEYITEDTKVDNKLKLGLRDAILYQTTAKEHPEVIERFEEELEKRGITVKKSLFDDFVMDMFIDEDEEEIEEDEENESLFNDYSAEQPELFNSTEMKVQEAFNRWGCCL